MSASYFHILASNNNGNTNIPTQRNELYITPNPASDFAEIQWSSNGYQSIIWDGAGRVVWKSFLYGEQQMVFPVSNLSDGTYSVEVAQENGSVAYGQLRVIK